MFYAAQERYSGRTVRLIPVIMVMAGLLVQISVLFLDYQKQYEALIYENAGRLSEHMEDRVSDLMEKGLLPDQLSAISPYFEKKAAGNDVIWNIRIIHSYMDTADSLGRVDQDTILNPVKGDGSLDVLVKVNRRFITGQMGKMTASFAVIFIICMMVSYEVMKLIDIVKRKRAEPAAAVSLDIKLLRGVCSLGFALFKYFMNSLVAAGSEGQESVSRNFALFDVGLLRGITVGGTVGTIVADARGYQFNYLFTSVLLMAALIGAGGIIPWDFIRQRRRLTVEKAKSAGIRNSVILRDKEVLKILLLGDVPLNIGLMYVVFTWAYCF